MLSIYLKRVHRHATELCRVRNLIAKFAATEKKKKKKENSIDENSAPVRGKNPWGGGGGGTLDFK